MRDLGVLCAQGAPQEVIGKMLELRADPNGGKGGAGSLPALGMLATAEAAGQEVLGSAQLLLDYKADVNQRCQPKDIARFIELMCRAYGFCKRDPPVIVKLLSDVSTTPLGSCALNDAVELAKFLLHARADTTIRNNRGLTPVDLAVSQQMRQLLSAPAHFEVPWCSPVKSVTSVTSTEADDDSFIV